MGGVPALIELIGLITCVLSLFLMGLSIDLKLVIIIDFRVSADSQH